MQEKGSRSPRVACAAVRQEKSDQNDHCREDLEDRLGILTALQRIPFELHDRRSCKSFPGDRTGVEQI